MLVSCEINSIADWKMSSAFSCLYSSDINVAERTTCCPHAILVLNCRCKRTQEDRVRQFPGGASGRVQSRGTTFKCQLSVLGILVLPDPPRAVDLSVMQEERWFSRRGEEVTTWITSGGEVTSGVDAIEAGREIALHAVLKGEDIVVVGDKIV